MLCRARISYNGVVNACLRKKLSPEYTNRTWTRLSSTQETQSSIPQDEPIKYSTSKAAKWTTRNSLGEPYGYIPPPAVQRYSIVASVVIFMVYFCILREENDVDEELGKSLVDRFAEFQKPH